MLEIGMEKREIKSGKQQRGLRTKTLRLIAHNFPLRYRHYLCYSGETMVIITDRCFYYYFYYI